jgi:hypothetical protein
MRTITTKKEYYQLWKDLALGNRIAFFENYAEFAASGFNGLTSIRYRIRTAPYKAFYVPAEDVAKAVDGFVRAGAQADLFTFNESTPDHKLLFQGELQYLDELGKGLTLAYNTRQCPMKEAMEAPREVTGMRTKHFLGQYLNPKSLDMLMELLTIYPRDAIEFGVYACDLGVMPGHNTIIWEVRGY